MKTRNFGLILASAMLVLLSAALIVSGAAAGPAKALVANDTGATQQEEAIIIDHTCTDLSQIPDYWLEQAKQLTIHYAHTSHGSQIVSGVEKLDQVDPQYTFDLFLAGSTPPSSLDCEAGALCMYDGNPPETYITPEDYWETSDGVDRTKAVADTGLFNYSMWSWCGQQSYYSQASVQQYLDTMATFETTYPDMRFILMTGHTDGGSTTLEQNNNLVRQYTIDHNKVLFDFADIETYDPLGGGPYVNNSEGTCAWCVDFCDNHPEYCTDLPSYCAHSWAYPEDALFCKLKGNAFWWMMARLAGWPGPDERTSQKTASTQSAVHGQTITYTIIVQNLTAPLTATVHVTDEVPAGLAYVPGSLSATSGSPDDSAAPTLRWTGELTPTPVVTITYVITVNESTSMLVTNTATIAAPDYDSLDRSVGVLINGHHFYLPLVVKGSDA